jgi:hypothetical protein
MCSKKIFCKLPHDAILWTLQAHMTLMTFFALKVLQYHRSGNLVGGVPAELPKV